MKTTLIITTALAVSFLSSCTGDPTKGGIFWSPSQAQERQNALRAEQTQKQAELDALQQRNEQLRRQKKAL